MFQNRIEALIDRHCLRLSDETVEIGKLLARCDPCAGPIEKATFSDARLACRKVRERGAAIGVDGVDHRAKALDGALGELEAHERVELWDMVEIMAMQADLAAAVDGLDADRSELYARCTTPPALEVAAVSPEAFLF